MYIISSLMSNAIVKHVPRCNNYLDEAYYTYTFTCCDWCIDKRRNYRKNHT